MLCAPDEVRALHFWDRNESGANTLEGLSADKVRSQRLVGRRARISVILQ